MTTWLNTPIQMQFRVIGGLAVRFAESEDCDDHALLLNPWPESLLAFAPFPQHIRCLPGQKALFHGHHSLGVRQSQISEPPHVAPAYGLWRGR